MPGECLRHASRSKRTKNDGDSSDTSVVCIPDPRCAETSSSDTPGTMPSGVGGSFLLSGTVGGKAYGAGGTFAAQR